MRGERGTAIVELALMLPLIIVLGFAAMEFSRYFKVSQEVSLLSRELANDVFRSCGERPVGWKLQQCVDTSSLSFYSMLNSKFEGLTLSVQVYQGGAITSSSRGVGLVSRAPLITSAPRFSQIGTIKDVIVLAEVQVNYSGIFTFLIGYVPGRVYEATLI